MITAASMILQKNCNRPYRQLRVGLVKYAGNALLLQIPLLPTSLHTSPVEALSVWGTGTIRVASLKHVSSLLEARDDDQPDVMLAAYLPSLIREKNLVVRVVKPWRKKCS